MHPVRSHSVSLTGSVSLAALGSFGSLAARAAARTEGVVIAIDLADAAAVALGRRDVLDTAADALVTLLVVANVAEQGLAVSLLHGHVGIDPGLRADLGDAGPAGTQVGVDRVKGIAEDGGVGKEEACSGLGINVIGGEDTAVRVLGDVNLRIVIGAEHGTFGFCCHLVLRWQVAALALAGSTRRGTA